MRKDLIADLQTGFDMNDPVRELYRLEELCSEAADELLKYKVRDTEELKYKKSYEALIDMWRHNMGYSISRLTENKGYDGYLLSGDHFHIQDFTGFCKRYGFETINAIVRELARGESDEVSDQ